MASGSNYTRFVLATGEFRLPSSLTFDVRFALQKEICIRMTHMGYARVSDVYMTVREPDGNKCETLYVQKIIYVATLKELTIVTRNSN